ncbi:hypothetical protein LCGC14_2152550 [marine sediment metagenome]|uniref:Septum formation initiator n=1 Tax=marine sediment metagenome TaxID=412755 RepID=A0A0F9DV94_9ZZZZ|nr:septum formation initiator family protein [Actinomycetota bacterium]
MASRQKVHRLRQRNLNSAKIQRYMIVFAVVSLALVWMSAPTLDLFKERGQNSILKERLFENKKGNKNLRADIKRLKTDPYIELKARSDLGLVKPNEIQYYVLTKKVKPKPKPKPKPKSWWQKTLDFIETTFSK